MRWALAGAARWGAEGGASRFLWNCHSFWILAFMQSHLKMNTRGDKRRLEHPPLKKYFQKADFQVLAWNWFYYLFNVILSMFGIILIFVRPVSWGVSSLRTGGQSARQKGRPILFSVNNAPWQLRNTKKKYKDKQIRARKIQEKIRVSLSSYTMYTMHQREIFICISIWLILKRGQWGNQ